MKCRPFFACLAVASFLAAAPASAQVAVAPDALVRDVSNDLLVAIQSDKAFQSGDLTRLQVLVDQRVMPHVDMRRLTSAAMGRYWRQATPLQQDQLQSEFKTLLVRSYATVLSEVSSRQTIEMRPMRSSLADGDVVVSTLVRGKGEPIPIDYRLYRSDADWKIYDVSVVGVWLGANYRNTFSQEIGTVGIDGLIERLQARNQTFAAASAAK